MLNIVVDTRENTPWAFPAHLATVRRGKLDAGDYALAGDLNFAIERKSLNDFIGTISTGWERFQNEIERMIFYPAMIVLIEGTFTDILTQNYNHPDMKPHFIIKRIAELAMQGVCVLFADNPVSAAGMAYKILVERQAQLND